MGFFFRKSVKLGPLRVNLSKSGIGISGGVKGARISTSSRGTELRLSRKGLSYRKKLSGRVQPPPTAFAFSSKRTTRGGLTFWLVLAAVLAFIGWAVDYDKRKIQSPPQPQTIQSDPHTIKQIVSTASAPPSPTPLAQKRRRKAKTTVRTERAPSPNIPPAAAIPPARRSTTGGYIRGPRGGCYYYGGTGRKVYVDRSLCN